MLSDNDIKYEYIKRNINIIMQRIEDNNYDYNSNHHEELEEVLNYLLLLIKRSYNDDTYNKLCKFSEKVKNIKLNAYQFNLIIRLGIKYVLLFASTTMKTKFEEWVIMTKNPQYIYLFAKNIIGANTLKLEDTIIEINDPEYMYLFLRDVKGASAQKIEDKIIASNNAEFIYLTAKELKEKDINKLESAIINTNDPKFIYLFAKDVNGANILKLEDKIIEILNPEYIYLFTKDVKEANKNRLLSALLKTNNEYYIELFMRLINKPKQEQHVNNPLENQILSFKAITEKDNIGAFIHGQRLSLNIRKKFINYLFDNIDKGNNYLILRIYLVALQRHVINKEEIDVLDSEYSFIKNKSKFEQKNPVLEIKRIIDNV